MGAPSVMTAAGALALAVMASCSLFVRTDGLAGAPPEDDAGTTLDATADAHDAGDADADVVRADPCAGGPVHCETFDEGDPLSRYEIDDDPETSISIDEALSVSPGRSAKFVIEPSPNGSPDATLAIETSPVLDVSFEGKLHIERLEQGEVGRLLFLGIDTATMYVEQSGAVVTSGPSSFVGAIPTGRWVTLRVELRRSTSPQTLTVTVDGAGPGPVDVVLSNTPSRFYARFGISEARSPKTGWIVRWDDIVIRHLQSP